MHTFIQDLLDGVLTGSTYAVLSAGLALIFGVMGVVNFAQAALMMMAMYLTYALTGILHVNVVASVAVAAAVFLPGGWSVARMLGRRLERVTSSAETQVIFTLGLAVVLQSVALMAFSGNPKVLSTGFANSFFSVGSYAIPRAGTVALAVMCVVGTGLFLLLERTRLGRGLRATAEDVEAARYMGIDPMRMQRVAFAIGAALAALGGGVLVLSVPASPLVGQDYITVMFVAVVLGGMGSIPGAMLGGLVVGIVGSASQAVVSPQLTDAVIFGIFLLVLFVRPRGLLSARQREV